MPKKDNSGQKSSTDGRRNNRPPEHGKIRPGEVRNPNGRRGKPPSERSVSSIDQMYLEEAARVVSHDDGKPVTAVRRLIQEEMHEALRNGDRAARSRFIDRVSEASERNEREHRERLNWFIEAKLHVAEQFARAKAMRRPPPDIVPHPDHVRITGDEIAFLGPSDRAGRKVWEEFKITVKLAAEIHRVFREKYRANPISENLDLLKSQEAHRRKLMRAVPKGWNWREEIFVRDSNPKLLEECLLLVRRRPDV